MEISRRGISRRRAVRAILFVMVGIILLINPFFLSAYGQGVMTRFLCFALFAMSYNVVFGYTGLLSLGHAAFFGAGGYVVGVLKLRYDITLFWIGFPLGLLMSTVTAALFGIIALRATGIYFLLVTFALGQMLYSLAWNVKWLCSPGMNGITGIPLPDLGIPGVTLNSISFYYIVLGFFLISALLLYRLVRSPYGLALVGIREGESRMKAIGYNTWLYKWMAFLITGFFAGVAGILFTYYNFFISPKHLGISTSFLPMVMSILGGLGTFLGPVIGAAIYILVETFSSTALPERWPLILGGLFIVTIMFARKGIWEYLLRFWAETSFRDGSTKS